MIAIAGPPAAPDHVLPGLMAGQSFTPPIFFTNNIGSDIGRPYDSKKPQNPLTSRWCQALISKIARVQMNMYISPILPQKRLATSRLEVDQAIAAANSIEAPAKKAWFTINAVRDKNRSANAATCKSRRPVSPDIFKSSAPAITAKSVTLHLKYGSPYQVTARKTGAKTNVDSRRVSINTNDRTITFPKRRSVGLADQTQTRLERNALS